MTHHNCHRSLHLISGAMILALAGTQLFGMSRPLTTQSPSAEVTWTSAARWRHGLKRSPGTLSITEDGVRFKAGSGPLLEWSFEEIQTFNLAPRRLKIVSYQNRRWHFHGERGFTFEFLSPMPAGVAEALARRVGKPSENGIPDPNIQAFAMLRARHRTRGGGTNGVLRFSPSGIEYITRSGRGARSWRWADIETIARPDPYHFRVSAYREIFSFELKSPMSEALFDRIWNRVYARNLTGLSLKGGTRP